MLHELDLKKQNWQYAGSENIY